MLNFNEKSKNGVLSPNPVKVLAGGAPLGRSGPMPYGITGRNRLGKFVLVVLKNTSNDNIGNTIYINELFISGCVVFDETSNTQSNIAFYTFISSLTFTWTICTPTTSTFSNVMGNSIKTRIIWKIVTTSCLFNSNLVRYGSAIITCNVSAKLKMAYLSHFRFPLQQPSVLNGHVHQPSKNRPPPFIFTNTCIGTKVTLEEIIYLLQLCLLPMR